MQEGLVLSGKYKLVRRIQVGGQATVYLAIIENNELSFSKEVVVKFFNSSESSFDSFFSEIKILTELNHPHIAKIHDVGIHDSSPYIVLEYIEGLNLKELKEKLLYKNTSFREGDILKILENVLEALIFIHHFKGQRLIHRDISPSNIMISRDGFVKLIDFGISNIPGNKLAGKPTYLPEKVLNGQEVYSESTDYYSLGVVIFELLSKRRIKSESDIDLSLIEDRSIRAFVRDLINKDVDAEKVLKSIKKRSIELDSDLRRLILKASDDQYISETTAQDIEVKMTKRPARKSFILVFGTLVLSVMSFWYFYKYTLSSNIEFYLENSISNKKQYVNPPALNLIQPIYQPEKLSKNACDNYCYTSLVSLATGHKDFYDKAIKDNQFKDLLEPSYSKQFSNFKKFYRPMSLHFESFGETCSAISLRCMLAKGFFRYIETNAPLAMTDAEFDKNLRRIMDGTDQIFKNMVSNVNSNKIKKPKKTYDVKFFKKFEDTFYNLAILKGDLDSESCRDIGDEIYLLKSSLSKREEDEVFFFHDFDLIILNNAGNIQFRGEEKGIPSYKITTISKDLAVEVCHYQRSKGKLTILQKWKVAQP